MNFLTALFGDESKRIVKKIRPIIENINALEEGVKKLSDEDFPKKTAELKARLGKGETLDALLPEAFALVREAAFRTLKQRHYDVQMIGGVVLHRGMIAEMKTGEGKTLVATLPAYLNALTGEGVHIVTVNDYLARRDAEWMGQIYAFLGLTTGVINDQNQSYLYDASHVETKTDEERDEKGSFKVFYEFLRPVSKKEAYAADITYGTNSQFGFDYLRDNTQNNVLGIVQRGHSFAIVDEVDSVLIDEARVPLILSTRGDDSESLYTTFARVASQLVEKEHFEKDEKLHAVTLNDAGIEKAEQLLKIKDIYTEQGTRYVHYLETAVKARALYLRDRDYVVKDGRVIIVDPFTGRMQEGRRWSEGLHQAIEAKEGVKIGEETKTLASITYQNYFKFYKKLAGMTGTAETSSEEFFKVYGLEVVEIPTHRPVQRRDNQDLIFQTEKGKFKAIAKKVKEIHQKGQPVLIGTISIEKNELLSAYLHQEGIPHTVLNAKNHESEGQIIAQAGGKGKVVIATNMAGRGVDIKLGGNPATKESEEEVKSLGGLFVLGTERHDARRIDNQLRGRSGRQGDPGETQFYVSLEDPLMRIFGAEKIQAMIGKLGVPEDQAIQNSFISKSLEKAQEKIEGFNFDSRKHVLEYDDVLSHHRNTIYERRRKILLNDEAFIAALFQEVVETSGELREKIIANKEKIGDEKFFPLFRRIALHITDTLWMEHLQVMEYTRQSVNLRAYGQREPIVEYKKEGLRLFREMEGAFRHEVANFIAHVTGDTVSKEEAKEDTSFKEPVEGMGRNDKVIIEKDGETQEMKWKKAEKFLREGWSIKETKQG